MSANNLCQDKYQTGAPCKNSWKYKVQVEGNEKLVCGVHVKKYHRQNPYNGAAAAAAAAASPYPPIHYNAAAAAAAAAGAPLNPLVDILRNPQVVREEPQNQQNQQIACFSTLDCGHACDGVFSDTKCICLRCLNLSKPEDNCPICLEELSSEAVIKLDCGHIFHYNCCLSQLKGSLDGLLNFSAIQTKFSCALCKQLMLHPSLLHLVEQMLNIREKMELLLKKYIGSEFLKEGTKLEDIYIFKCNMCDEFEFGGHKSCVLGSAGPGPKPENFRPCSKCLTNLDGRNCSSCKIHGKEHISWRCDFCCDVATFRCGIGNFCTSCHSNPFSPDKICKHPSCPYPDRNHKVTAQTGLAPRSQALGCGLCKAALAAGIN